MRFILIAFLSLLAIGCASQLETAKIAYCFDDASHGASRTRSGVCREHERAITEQEFVAYAGWKIVPGSGRAIPADAAYCFSVVGNATYARDRPCFWDEIQVTQADYAAHIGSGELPTKSIKSPGPGMVYCLNPDSGMVYAGEIKLCMPGDRSIDRFEYMPRLKEQTYL